MWRAAIRLVQEWRASAANEESYRTGKYIMHKRSPISAAQIASFGYCTSYSFLLRCLKCGPRYDPSLHAAASLEVIRKTQHGVQNAPNCITRRSILGGITGDFVWAIIADRRDAKYPTTTYTDAASNFIMVRCSGAWPTSSGTSASSTAHHDHKVNFARHFITRRGLIVYERLNMAKV